MKRFSSLLVGLVLLPWSQAVAADEEKAFIGTWYGHVEGHREVWTIKKENDKWSVAAAYHKDGKQVGSFVGKDVKYADGVLTFVQEFEKVPPEKTWKNGAEHFVKLERDRLSYTWQNDTAKGSRWLSKDGTDNPKQLAGKWEGMAEALKEVWTIKIDGEKISVSATYLSDNKPVGGFIGKDVKYANGVMTFVQKYDKVPEGVAWQDGATYTVRSDGKKLSYTWRLGKSSGTRALEPFTY